MQTATDQTLIADAVLAHLFVVSGPDAETYIQGQTTNDIRKILTSHALHTLWLDHRGRALGDSLIWRHDDHSLAIAGYHFPAPDLNERLEAFRIADDVAWTDLTPATSAFVVAGPRSDDVLQFAGLPVPPRSHGSVARSTNGTVVLRGRRGDLDAADVLAPAATTAETRTALHAAAASLGLPPAPPAAVDRLRLQAAVPSVPGDIGPADLAAEAGLDDSAVSFTKGCYLGQEVMARIRSQGRLRRRLVPVRLEGSPPPGTHPQLLGMDGRPAGDLRSWIAEAGGGLGFALVLVASLPGPWATADGSAQVHPRLSPA